MFTTALVIGKFYPPHNGHKHLVEVAAQGAQAVVVLVLGSQFESISLANRKNWLAEEFLGTPNITVIAMPNDCPEDYSSDEIWAAQLENMRLALKINGIEQVDAVYSSEPYGARLAARFGAEGVEVDVQRARNRISGTRCRNDLQENWQHIMPAARRGLAVRIIVVGAESTGTTTLSQQLSQHYKKQYPALQDVVEFGRQYTYKKLQKLQETLPNAQVSDLVWTAADFGIIAQTQTAMEQAAAEVAPLVIADTDALATMLWERYYMGEESFGSYGAQEHLPRRDLYLITDHQGVDFEDDGWREGEHRRPEMNEWFKESLTAAGHSWVLVTGTPERRLSTAVAAVDQLLQRQRHFDSPVWAAQKSLPDLGESLEEEMA